MVQFIQTMKSSIWPPLPSLPLIKSTTLFIISLLLETTPLSATCQTLSLLSSWNLMYDHVMSLKTAHNCLSQLQVTVFDRIIGLEVFPKFYDANGVLQNPKGPNNNLLPVRNNVTFFFNITQGNTKPCQWIMPNFILLGAVQTLYFMESVNGNNVSLINVTVPEGTDLRTFSVDIPFDEVRKHLSIVAYLFSLCFLAWTS